MTAMEETRLPSCKNGPDCRIRDLERSARAEINAAPVKIQAIEKSINPVCIVPVGVEVESGCFGVETPLVKCEAKK